MNRTPLRKASWSVLLLGWVGLTSLAAAGPYSAVLGDANNLWDAPVPGFVGPNGLGRARLLQSGGTYENPDNYVNPIFFNWASSVVSYAPAPGVAGSWSNSALALGAVTGDLFDIVALGDLNATQLGAGATPGSVTLHLAQPVRNLSDADFVVYENGLISAGGAGVAGQLFGELAYVEVSSDGVNFARFPSVSLTAAAVPSYGTIDPTQIFNLAGKHANGYGESWGTPFDLNDLATDPLVLGGQVDLNNITSVRVVDIPGNGSFKDSLNHSIYDAWVTSGSGGFDLEAVGVISRTITWAEWLSLNGLTGPSAASGADPDGDGLSNFWEYAAGRSPLHAESTTTFSRMDFSGAALAVIFTRDERARDLIYEVQVSTDLQSWSTLARSIDGQPLTGQNGFTPSIVENRAGDNASVGVIREVRVTDVVAINASVKRFLRVKVSRAGGS
jgi:hypothetical protein